jgi:peroxiredoxin
MEVVLLLIRIILFGIFALAGIGKLLDLPGSEKAVKDFGVPEDLAKPFSILLPVAEIFIAVLLLFVQTSWLGAIGGFLLLLVFIGGMIFQMAKGNAPDCHCFGQIHSEPVSAKSLIRNAVFASLAFVLIVSGSENQGLSLFDSSNDSSEGNFMSLILGFATVGLLAAAVYFLKLISEQQTQIMRRIEILELTSHEGREIERENVSNPREGLPIGASVPDFELPDVNGRSVAFEHLLAQSKPMLFFFVSPNCIPCAALLPEIEAWQKELEGKINFVFISSGQAKENLDKFAGGNLKQILLQKDREVSTLFGALWTPTALLVNADGTIASHPAAGDAAIRELVEKTKAQNFEEKFLFVVNENSNGNGKPPKIGENVPEFSIEDISGKQISQNNFQGRKTLVAFWSLTCPHCINMMEDLREWENQKGQDEPNLIVFSDGETEAHKTLNLNSPILIDKEYEIAQNFGMHGTPSAVLVNEDGRIVSETAIGAEQIWALVGKRK